MNFKGIKYQFKTEPWKYSLAGSWVFVSLPLKISKEIRTYLKSEEQGWGRMKATAQIGRSEWETAIWFDTKANTYILPLKSEIRKKENVVVGKKLTVTVTV
jgi:hypothetical protein